MSFQYINTGTSANAGNGDSLRSAFSKINNNFTVLSTASFGGSGNGYTGSQGDIGYTGSQGDIGYTGSQGPAGQGIILPGDIGQLAFFPETGAVVGQASGITYSTVSQTLVIGNSIYPSTNVFWVRESYSAAQPRGWVFTQHYNDSDVLNFSWNRTRGTFANQTPLIVDDDIADLVFTTQNGPTPVESAAITVRIENTSSGYAAGKFMFFTNSGTTSTGNLVSELSSTGTFKFTKISSLITGTGLIVEDNLIPAADLTYDLGSTSSQWRSLYVGTGTIYIGGVALGLNADRHVTIDGNPIITVNTAGKLTVQGDVAIGTVIISDTAPEPSSGVQWFNTQEARTYVAYNDQWVDANPTVLAPPDTNPALESVTFNDNTTQTTAWSGTYSYNDLTDKPDTPAFVGGGGANTWLTAD
jgi:hypothetical protein